MAKDELTVLKGKSMDTLDRKVGLVVERTEQVNPEDMATIDLSLIFILDVEDEEHSTTLKVQTDDRAFFEKFKINESYTMEFLKDVTAKAEVVRN